MVFLYLPTFRDTGKKCFSFFDEKENVKKITGNFIIIEKGHFADININQNIKLGKNIFNGIDIDTQDLIAIADLYITDYSSCIFDFLVMDKPIINVVFDYDYYFTADRGLCFNVEDMDCGHIAYDKQMLFSMIQDFCNTKWQITLQQKRVKKQFITYESKNNSENVYQHISKV